MYWHRITQNALHCFMRVKPQAMVWRWKKKLKKIVLRYFSEFFREIRQTSETDHNFVRYIHFEFHQLWLVIPPFCNHLFACLFLLVDLLHDHTSNGCFLDDLNTCLVWHFVGKKSAQIVCLGHSANVRDRPKYTFSFYNLVWNSLSNFCKEDLLKYISIFS